ncbi:hypothetical protein GZL_09117 [Streptomyces sp. 769]|nr:hypothetical protein GZL_09117 [Streptomyces sp. 769]
MLWASPESAAGRGGVDLRGELERMPPAAGRSLLRATGASCESRAGNLRDTESSWVDHRSRKVDMQQVAAGLERPSRGSGGTDFPVRIGTSLHVSVICHPATARTASLRVSSRT